MLTTDEVRKIAKLANLDLSEDDLKKYASQLSEILDYVAVLNKQNTSSVAPTYQVTGLSNVFREDIVTPSLSQADALKNAKETERGYFVAERVKAGVQ